MHSPHRPPPPPPLRRQSPVATRETFPLLRVAAVAIALLVFLLGSAVVLAVFRVAPVSQPTEDADSFMPLGVDERPRREREKQRMAEQRRNEQKQQEEAKAAAEAAAQAAAAKRLEDEKRRADSEAEKQKREQEAKRQRAAAALAALRKMPEIVVQDLVTGGGLGTFRVTDVDLGPFDIDALAEPGFALAVPKDECDGAPFNAWVEEPPPGQKSWRILGASRAVDAGTASPVHLATLTARDGSLHLMAADAKVAKNSRFNLLRRSVLLVKARDPALPNGEAAVQRTIQLGRPAAGIMQWEVSLLKKETLVSLPRLPDTTVPVPGSAAAPALPSDTRITYEVRFDYPLQYRGGEPLEKPEVRTFQASTFCPLIECTLPDQSMPEKPTVGVKTSISLHDGKVAFRPDVEGPGQDDIDLGVLADFAQKSDRPLEEWLKNALVPLKMRVNDIKRQPVTKFPGSQAEKSFLALSQAESRSLEEYFKAEKLFPPTGYNDSRVEQWTRACRRIVEQAEEAAGVAEVRAAGQAWQEAMVSHLEAWLEHHEKQLREKIAETRLALKPLASPATVVVTELSSPAYDADGKRYDVVLATPSDETPPRRATGGPRTTSSDLD